jgi:hypothetical protein
MKMRPARTSLRLLIVKRFGSALANTSEKLRAKCFASVQLGPRVKGTTTEEFAESRWVWQY